MQHVSVDTHAWYGWHVTRPKTSRMIEWEHHHINKMMLHDPSLLLSQNHTANTAKWENKHNPFLEVELKNEHGKDRIILEVALFCIAYLYHSKSIINTHRRARTDLIHTTEQNLSAVPKIQKTLIARPMPHNSDIIQKTQPKLCTATSRIHYIHTNTK